MMEYEITPESLNNAQASRKNDRVFLALALTQVATRHGASVERREEQATRGYCGQGIHLQFACKGVGAMIDINDLHGGNRALISWFGTDHKALNFTSRFDTMVGGGNTGRAHHKATSCPSDWYSLAMMLDAGLLLAARGEAFDGPSAT